MTLRADSHSFIHWLFIECLPYSGPVLGSGHRTVNKTGISPRPCGADIPGTQNPKADTSPASRLSSALGAQRAAGKARERGGTHPAQTNSQNRHGGSSPEGDRSTRPQTHRAGGRTFAPWQQRVVWQKQHRTRAEFQDVLSGPIWRLENWGAKGLGKRDGKSGGCCCVPAEP